MRYLIITFLAALSLHATELSLNGSWQFRFEENKAIEDCTPTTFTPTDTMLVPGCFDALPQWHHKRGTGLYRRTFTLDKAVDNAWLIVDGIGLRGEFFIDGKSLGVHPYPYARLELPTGALAAGAHTIYAALDNRFDWERNKLAIVFYDFYFYGGIYRGMSLSFDNRKLRVRTRNYATGEIEIEAVNFPRNNFATTITFDNVTKVEANFVNSHTTVKVPNFKLWSPDEPNLHRVALDGVNARFGIRTIEARERKLFLNGRELFLKGVNRHDQSYEFGATIDENLMLMDLQILKNLNANFIRGAHYQQSQRFLDLCDEMGMLVWEESLGWGNGQSYTKLPGIDELNDEAFSAAQIFETRSMVQNSFNHPSVIIFGFLNECSSNKKECKILVDKLITTIKAEDSGRLVTFACNLIDNDICCENVDLVSFNAYPGTIPANPDTPEALRTTVSNRFTSAVSRFRKLYSDKPIMVSESGVGTFYGQHDPLASFRSEEFQVEYLTDIFDTLWSNPDVVGFSIWQFADTHTHHRNCLAKYSGRELGISVAGIVDFQRRPKKVCETVRNYFRRK